MFSIYRYIIYNLNAQYYVYIICAKSNFKTVRICYQLCSNIANHVSLIHLHNYNRLVLSVCSALIVNIYYCAWVHTVGNVVSPTFPLTLTPGLAPTIYHTNCVAKNIISCLYGDTMEWLDRNSNVITTKSHSRIYGMYAMLFELMTIATLCDAITFYYNNLKCVINVFYYS